MRSLIRRYVQEYEQLRYYNRKKLSYIHINKTGGTFIQEALDRCKKNNKIFIKTYGHTENITDLVRNTPFFFSIRDPFDRLCSSCYQFFKHNNHKEYSVMKHFSNPEDLIISISDPLKPKHQFAKILYDCAPHISKSYWDFFISENYFYAKRPNILIALDTKNLSASLERLIMDLYNIKLDYSTFVKTQSLKRQSNNDYHELNSYRKMFLTNLGLRENNFYQMALKFSSFDESYNTILEKNGLLLK